LTWWARVINRSIIALFAREHSGADRIGAGGYRADIDGLGAVAILSVVIYRAVKDVARGGFVGVDFFRYLRVPDQRRLLSGQIRRILPALCWQRPGQSVGWRSGPPGRQISAAAVFASNLVLMHDSGYFAPSADVNPLLHLQSLSIEKQFYLVWPITLVLARKARLKASAMISAICIAWFAVTVSGESKGDTTVFFSPITRSWELARGALLASAEIGSQRSLDAMLGTPVRGQRPQPFAVDIRDLVAGLGFGALIASIVLVRDSWSCPSWITVLPTGGAALLIGADDRAWVNRAPRRHNAG
jgi:peptidoglycan/LPS O-acetylase OafA/YrhL